MPVSIPNGEPDGEIRSNQPAPDATSSTCPETPIAAAVTPKSTDPSIETVFISTDPARLDGEIVQWVKAAPYIQNRVKTADEMLSSRELVLQSVNYLANKRARMQPKVPSTPFRFVDLPLEIKNNIYDAFSTFLEQGFHLSLSDILASSPRYHESLIYTEYPEDDAVPEYREEDAISDNDRLKNANKIVAVDKLNESDKQKSKTTTPVRYVRRADEQKLSITADSVPIMITRRSLLSVSRQIHKE
ncbi:hypothetical protein LTR84_011334 [Exophiala bonariae]|uniref:Uncharacterized protein n=1 Tax=Exophiala bonariae TaxID=1690606 RepID=A0AAV9MRV7_9EURO|nr:hypothetical protein LTR84_011334 [Exophiala bonariae]